LCEEAKVPYFRFHAIRHSGASLLAEQPDVPVWAIQTIPGHEDLRTTEIYLHSTGKPERMAIRKLDSERKSHTNSHTIVSIEKGRSA